MERELKIKIYDATKYYCVSSTGECRYLGHIGGEPLCRLFPAPNNRFTLLYCDDSDKKNRPIRCWSCTQSENVGLK